MKCPYCGAEAQGRYCEYCGSEMPQEKPTIQIVNNYYVDTQTKGSQSGNTTQNPPRKKNKIWLWVLGWIFIFPLPLTIRMLRNKDRKPGVKYGVIAVAWLLYFAIGLLGGNTDAPAPQTVGETYSTVAQVTEPS